MERHTAMLRQNQTDGCLSCQNGAALNPHSCWKRKGTGAPLTEQLRQPTAEPIPHSRETPLVPPGVNAGAHASEIESVPPGYVFLPTPVRSAEYFNLDADAKDRKWDKDFHPVLLTDEGTSTG